MGRVLGATGGRWEGTQVCTGRVLGGTGGYWEGAGEHWDLYGVTGTSSVGALGPVLSWDQYGMLEALWDQWDQ